MDLLGDDHISRLELMRKRRAHFIEIVKDYASMADFNRDWDEKMCMFGIELNGGDTCTSLYMQLDFTEYETYYVVIDEDGHLTVSPIVGWQNECCANSYINLLTGERADDEDI